MKAAAFVLVAGLAASASAHPVDEVVQGAYLLVGPGTVRLQLEITPGPAVSRTVVRVLDANGDGVMTRVEKQAYGLRVLSQCGLSLDGQPVAWRFDQIGVPAYGMLQQQAGTVQLFAHATMTGDARGRRLVFRNAYRPARGPTTANIFAEPGTRGIVFDDQHRTDDGRSFTVTVISR